MKLTAAHRLACLTQLNRLIAQNGSVTGAAVVLRDGRSFAHTVSDYIDSGKFAAMVSSTTTLGETVMRELSGGAFDHVVVKASQANLVMVKVPDCNGLLILALLTTLNSLPGLALSHAKMCAFDIGQIVNKESVSAAK